MKQQFIDISILLLRMEIYKPLLRFILLSINGISFDKQLKYSPILNQWNKVWSIDRIQHR